MIHVENHDIGPPDGGADGLPRDYTPILALLDYGPLSPISTTYDEDQSTLPPIPETSASDRREAEPEQLPPRTNPEERRARYHYTIEEATQLAETAEDELRVEQALARNAAARRQAEIIRLKEKYREAEFLLDVRHIQERVKEATRVTDRGHSINEKQGENSGNRKDGDHGNLPLPHRPGMGPVPDPDDDEVPGLELPHPREVYSLAMTQNIQMEPPRVNTHHWQGVPTDSPGNQHQREFDQENPHGKSRRSRGGRARRSRPRSSPYGGWDTGSRQTTPGPSGTQRFQC